MQAREKKPWMKPKLICFTKVPGAMSILSICKSGHINGPGMTGQPNCYKSTWNTGGADCANCCYPEPRGSCENMPYFPSICVCSPCHIAYFGAS